jgi:hypothetical protein
MVPYSMITDISFLNSLCRTKEEFAVLSSKNIFSDENTWKSFAPERLINGLTNLIDTPLKKRMSQLSLGVYYTMENGPGNRINPDEEIYLFSAFGEIDTTDKIIKTIVNDGSDLVSPTLFHNSVHNTPLGYYTIIKKRHNYCTTVSDGLSTNLSFMDFIDLRVKMDEPFTVVTGEEYSPFFELDRTTEKKIIPAFASYRISPGTEKGFKFSGICTGIDVLLKNQLFMDASCVFADRETFLLLNKKTDKKLFTEYPFVCDNPCGIIFRLALPFYLDIKENSLVIEKIFDSFRLFEVENR